MEKLREQMAGIDAEVVDLPPHTPRSNGVRQRCVEGVGDEIAFFTDEELQKYRQLVESDIQKHGPNPQTLKELEKVDQVVALRADFRGMDWKQIALNALEDE
ncbi:hypothetical protein HDU96_001160 [Phlyctochytrium bullatum]|nr:hypothetical protein HDU96_001160 [Phlyctochytrium bullatum]